MHHPKSPISPELKNRPKSGPDSPLKALGIENIALDKLVRLGWLRMVIAMTTFIIFLELDFPQ